MKTINCETKLFNGLPAVRCDDHWTVISPYAGEIVRIPYDKINDAEIKKIWRRRLFLEDLQIKDQVPCLIICS